MSRAAADAISAAWAGIQVDEERAIQERRFAEAKAIVAEIPSGTRDEDLTPRHRRALDQYEDAIRRLRELRERDE